jgi:Na+/pantothenate symporter
VFVVYTAVVFALAWLSHRVLAGRSFLGEYFLGSRSLGMVALALTFGATSASAGSFAGFPALIYTHGWVLALWIASYMIFPLCGMGLLGKRLNQVARRTGAITIPDILRARFGSPGLALLSTVLMAFLLAVYLIPQFKLAALIMEQLLGRNALFQSTALGLAAAAGGALPGGESAEYLLGLFLFAGLVVLYTTFGGFRAVVWTDILQGFVMVAGVLIMLGITLALVGGLGTATEQLKRMTPPRVGEVVFTTAEPAPPEGHRIPADTWLLFDGSDGAPRLIRTNQPAAIVGADTASAPVLAVEVTTPAEAEAVLAQFPEGRPPPLPAGVAARPGTMHDYAHGAAQPGTYVTAPGPSADDTGGFLPLGLAVSFFVFWALSGTGQPGNMVRLMAFDTTRTLKRAIAALSVYFMLIYFPLVVIFACARVLAPALDQTPDRIMPVMAFFLPDAAGVPWLAGLLIAAPFAAAMSTVDSFMLMISSSVVRDVYQQHINPAAPERTLKRLSYACTLVVGIAATVGAVYPPRFLQYLIVFTGGGLAVAFLVPVALGVYWPRFNKAGAYAAMLGGVGVYLLLYLTGFLLYGGTNPVRPLGLDPLIWGFAASLAFGWGGTYLTVRRS